MNKVSPSRNFVLYSWGHDKSSWEQLPTMTLWERSETVEILGPHLAAIELSIVRGWDCYMALPIEARVKLSRRAQANVVHDFIVDEATRNLPAAEISDLSELKVFVIENAAIRFKKFDESRISRNQRTAQVCRFRGQECLDGIQALINLEAGYVLDKLGQALRAVHLVCPNGPRNYWHIDLRDIANTTSHQNDIFEKPIAEKNENEATAIWRRRGAGVVIPIKRNDEKDA